MGRPRRVSTGGFVYHVLNRATARSRIFHSAADYQAFERILVDARERFEMRILAFCIMPNHWHLALWPRKDNDLSRFTGWLTLTHTQHWHVYDGSAGKAICTRDELNHSLLNPMSTCCRCAATLSAMHYAQTLSNVRKNSAGAACGIDIIGRTNLQYHLISAQSRFRITGSNRSTKRKQHKN